MVWLATEHWDIPNKDILSWIFDAPGYDPDKPILIDASNTSRSISSNQARKLIRQLIAGFRHAGLQRGDCVCIHSFNDIYYPILFLAIVGAGGVFTGTNPAYTLHELKHHLKVAKVKFLISEPEIFDALSKAAEESNVPDENIFVFHPLPQQKVPVGRKSWTKLFESGEEDWVRFDDLQTCSTTTATRFTSSGTTGLPKAVIWTHRNLIAQHELVHEGSKKRPYDVVHLLPLPFFHAAVGPKIHTTVLKDGWETYVMRRFDVEGYLSYCEKYKVTEIGGVPPMIIALIMSPLNKKYSMKAAKSASSGGAPLGKGPQGRFEDLLGGAPMTQVWGMTEATSIVTMLNWDEHDDTGSSGRPIANLDIKIVDDSGKDITAYDTVGELCVRGPTIFPGYFENAQADKVSFDEDGFFHSGDVGYCDGKSKLFYIVDRKKELIKVRGFQVAPPELEAVLLMHPNILDAAVIGVPAPDERNGELPRAYVVRRPGADASKLGVQDVIDFAGEKLVKYKRLDGGVKFVDSIPKNASGKILKRTLREEVKKEFASPSRF